MEGEGIFKMKVQDLVRGWKRGREVRGATLKLLACVLGQWAVPFPERRRLRRSRAGLGLGQLCETLRHPRGAGHGWRLDAQVWGARLHKTVRMPLLPCSRPSQAR